MEEVTMTKRKNEILEELQSVLKGKTLDAMLPPLVFVVVNSIYGLNAAAALSIATALAFSVVRLVRKQTVIYALGGLSGVVVAVAFAYLAGNAANYFIPKIIGSALTLLLTLGSLIIGKPLAAYASHLTRGWPLEWFWRKDVKPAYREVTWFWSGLFLLRLGIQILLFLREDLLSLFWVNTLLGLPFTILILISSYIYGIWRLRKLGGPGVEEFIEGKEAPWKGQTRGF